MDDNHSESKTSTDSDASTIKIIAPPRCPFSGIAIDPKLWQTFKEKMEAKNNGECDDDDDDDPHAIFGDLLKIQHRHQLLHTSNDEDSEIPILNITEDNEINDEQNEQEEEFENLTGSVPSSILRVRIINSVTERSKDLVIDSNSDETLWNAIYDNAAVKQANVRKWNSQIAQKVKHGMARIELHLWDSHAQQPWHSYTLEELKHTTTRQLYEQVFESSTGDHDLVLLKLKCVDRE